MIARLRTLREAAVSLDVVPWVATANRKTTHDPASVS
jgi:hypothetical protein